MLALVLGAFTTAMIPFEGLVDRLEIIDYMNNQILERHLGYVLPVIKVS